MWTAPPTDQRGRRWQLKPPIVDVATATDSAAGCQRKPAVWGVGWCLAGAVKSRADEARGFRKAKGSVGIIWVSVQRRYND